MRATEKMMKIIQGHYTRTLYKDIKYKKLRINK